MKRTLSILALALTTYGYAQEAGYTIHVDFKTGDAVQCVSTPITTAKTPLGSFEVSALFAMQSNTSLGIAVSKRFDLGQAYLSTGLAVRSLQEPGSEVLHFRAGFVLTVGVRF